MSITCHVQIDKFILKNNNSMIQCVTCNNSSLFAPKQEKNKYFEITKINQITCAQNILQKMYIVHNHTKISWTIYMKQPKEFNKLLMDHGVRKKQVHKHTQPQVNKSWNKATICYRVLKCLASDSFLKFLYCKIPKLVNLGGWQSKTYH